MQMITLDASVLDFYNVIYESIDSGLFSNVYILIVGVLHILVPVLAIITAYDCIVSFLSYIRVEIINLRSSDIYVFSEMNENSINLALDISKIRGHNAEFIFSNSSDNKKVRSCFFSKLNFYTVTSDKIDSLDIKVKRTKKIYFFNISDNSDENINNTLSLSKKYLDLPKDKQKLIQIYLYSNNKETETIVDSMNKGILGVNFIDTARLCIYKLFDEHPLYEAITNGNISLLICGMNSVGEETLKAAIWLGQLVDIKLKINVVDPDAVNKKSNLELKYPEIFNGEYYIKFHQSNFDDCSFRKILKEQCVDTSYAVVCGSNDEDNIGTALYLRRFFLKEDLTVKRMPIIAAYIDNYEKADVVNNLKTPEANESNKINYEIIPFGGANSIYTYDSIMNNPIEMLSINVHLAYEEIFNGTDDFNHLEALECYNAFEVNKRSNRANALHIRYKLWMLGLDYTDDSNACEVNLSDYINKDTLNKLTIAEHDRWMAFLRTEGWESASIEDVQNYKKTGLSKGKHNCSLLKMHPYICDFDKLDIISNELGLPDATKFDRDLITMIPSILKNKTINNCDFKIIKRGN